MRSKTRRRQTRRRQTRKKNRSFKGGMDRNEATSLGYHLLRLFNPADYLNKPRLNIRNVILNRTNRPNDENYTWFKYTILPAGTTLRFRSTEKLEKLETPEAKKGRTDREAMWFNYTETLGKPSFEVLNDRVDPTIVKGMSTRFGPWLNTVRTLKPFKILHFPVDYRYTKKGNLFSYTSEFESVIMTICTAGDMDPLNICADGYTLDFLYRSLEYQYPPFNDAPFLVQGFREIALLHPKPGENIELISSEHMPVS